MISVNAVKDSNGDLYVTSSGLLVVDNVAVGLLIDVNNNIFSTETGLITLTEEVPNE